MIQNIAHRGYSIRYPENTLLSFSKALETGCDGIELDVQLSRDGIPVIMHDELVDRTSDGHGPLKDMTFAQLRELHLPEGEQIPALAEYFELVKNSAVWTNIELKNSVYRYEGMEEAVLRLIDDYGLAERVMISSFNHFSLLTCKKLAPQIPCAFLTWSWLIHAGAYTRSHGIEYYHPEFHSLNREAVEELHQNGIRINAYTADCRQEFLELIRLGVDGIITDDPALLREVLQSR